MRLSVGTKALSIVVHFPICPSSDTMTASVKKPFLTLEDLKMCFSLFCCVYGIGTLGMPGNYARAGYGWATVALVLMAAINIYATWCISKVMMVAPRSIRTFGDLGEWSMGCFGRWITNIAQMLVCVMVPIMFLVLGGTIFTIMFPSSFKETTWIIIMGLTLLPVCLIPTLKEGAGAAAAGALGTILADGIALGLLVHNMNEANDGLSPPHPDLSFKQVTTVFGNLALAYGAGIVVPTLQREHSDETRMPRIIVVTLTVVSVFFLIVSITGVSVTGCQIPGNLLFAISGTKLGFQADNGGVILSMMSMQLHITIAFAVVMFPAFFIAERIFLGLHKTVIDRSEPAVYNDLETPADLPEKTSALEPIEYPSHDAASDYAAPGVYLKAAIIRIIMIIIAVVIAIAWKDHFGDLLDFVGASSTSLSCMILPIIFYLKTFWKTIRPLEKAGALFAIIICIALAIYVSINTGKVLFGSSSDGPKFPYCAPEYQNMVYTNRTYYNITK
ncbi:Amino Acid/Auxin Permease (AAAP) Family [Achlya hypogyna]|uniref:Amino Acid/Auxin Permease (AAAP) Family n=1 Tax=Achlya hypogyna TaxID=1202772 RepID=A0A1V9YU42_ACHHY|nr:Amino Acid/Auxin Permease (AAAP) Family [Achlya hypogyna]